MKSHLYCVKLINTITFRQNKKVSVAVISSYVLLIHLYYNMFIFIKKIIINTSKKYKITLVKSIKLLFFISQGLYSFYQLLQDIFSLSLHMFCDYNSKSYANGVFTGIIIFLKFILRRHELAQDEMCAFSYETTQVLFLFQLNIFSINIVCAALSKATGTC